MDDTFRVRVDKTFGSLTAPSNLTSLWSLTDDEIDKREWNRDSPIRDLLDVESKPCPPHIDGFFAKSQQTLAPLDFPKNLHSDLEELSDEEQERGDNEESDIRSCIGLDCTLDNEEEEDEFDEVAVAKEKEKQQLPSDRLYMQEVSDYGISSNTYHELPLTLEDVKRDPRANHMAAMQRLKEDAEAALAEGHFSSVPPAAYSGEECQNDDAHSPNLPSDSSSVPDYVRNPSKYTCYILDASDDMDEESNRKAYMDFLSSMNKRVQLEDDSSASIHKLPTFNPRMKQQQLDGHFTNKGIEAEQVRLKKTVPLSIAAVEEEETSQVSAMEEDESFVVAHKAKPGRLLKPGRSYRTRAIMDTDNHNA